MFNGPVKLALGATIAFFAASSVTAQDLTLDWWTVDGGGEMSTVGGDLELSGTIGQPDANTTVMTGGSLELTGGFWAMASSGPPLPGDCDGDGDVDLTDYAVFADCLTGPSGDLMPNCTCSDINTDGDVDLADFIQFQQVFTGG